MKKRRLLILCITICLFFPINVQAHPGRTDSKGCHTCKTNCEKWGLSYGEYHCHNGGSTSSSTSKKNSSSSTNNKTTSTTKKPQSKSSNKNISSISVDDDKINIAEEMNYETTNNNPKINIIPEDKNAKYTTDQKDSLELGINEIKITITAEDQTKKEYTLYIKLISQDTSLKSIIINNENLDITKDNLIYTTTENKITVEAIPNFETTSIISEKEYFLKDGENEVIIKVLAEDQKTTQEYKLTVIKETNAVKEEKTETKILSNNVNVKIFIDGQKINFKNFYSELINLSPKEEQIAITYELEDKNAKIELPFDRNIKPGENKLIEIKVIAENGDEQMYLIKVHRYTQIEFIMSNVLAIAILCGAGYGIYWLIKKIRKGREK